MINCNILKYNFYFQFDQLLLRFHNRLIYQPPRNTPHIRYSLPKLLNHPHEHQILNRVNPADPNGSQLFITTDPGGNAAHPYKFNGNGGDFNNFRNAVAKWIADEN